MHSGKTTNGRPDSPPVEPDAHGQAALLLTESLLHALVETSTLSLADALAVVQTAAEVKIDVAAQIGESTGRMQASLNLLAGIATSLRVDDAIHTAI